MKRFLLTIALVLGVSHAVAQTPPNFDTLMVPNGGVATAVNSGTTRTNCSTTQVLFALSGAVSCDSGFTYAGSSGAVAMGGALNVSGTFGLPGTFLFQSGTMFWRAGAPTATLAFGSGHRLTWDSTTDGGNGSSDTGIARNAAGVMEVDNGTAGVFGGLKVAALSATLPTATGTNVVCNTPGTSTALSVQVSATGCAASSIRFKEAITAIDREKAFETILALQPVSYFYKPELNMGSDRHIGFTAEQVGNVDPSLITVEDDGVTPHAVKYNEMAPLFAAAIQQLKADNDNLRAELDDLKRRMR